MREPCIKGIAFQFIANAIETLLAEGKLQRAEVEAELAPEDLELLDGELLPGLWYPIESFGRLLAFALEKEGSPPERWPEMGFEVAEELLAARTYGGPLGAATGRGRRSGFALVHLVPLFLNFSEWRFEENPSDGSIYRVHVTQAEALPDPLVSVVEGMIECFSQRARGLRLRVSSERIGKDRIIFRATHAKAPLPD